MISRTTISRIPTRQYQGANTSTNTFQPDPPPPPSKALYRQTFVGQLGPAFVKPTELLVELSGSKLRPPIEINANLIFELFLALGNNLSGTIDIDVNLIVEEL